LRRLSPLLASLTVASSLAVPVAAAPKAPAAGAAGLSRSGSQAALLQLPEALPLAPALKGDRPKSNPKVLPPAATTLPPELRDLVSPASLALPDRPRQVRINQLRPLSLDQVEILAEVNSPDLMALASQVEQAQSNLRAKIALWYPQLGFNTTSFPFYTAGQESSTRDNTNPSTSSTIRSYTTSNTGIWQMQAALEASWALIDPTRTPQIAIARDQYEKAKNQYLIGLRDLRLQASLAYFDLQTADNQVQIGQEGVRASLVSLRDARARFQAGVATKLEVLEAETQLARDQQLLTTALLSGTPGQPGQATARRALASLLDLPQDVTPTAADPARVIGTWLPSLQESIVASFSFREELDQILLDISIANSAANAGLGRVQPFLRIVNRLGFGNSYTNTFSTSTRPPQLSQIVTPITSWNVDNSVGLNINWSIYDGGSAQATYREQKQKAQENRFLFAQRRNTIRSDVERSFYELDKNNRNILTTSREVISTRESLRLARLRFQAGVTTQREVVDTQRDLTQAEVRYSTAISDYNRALVQLRRRTGLDQIATCEPPRLPANKPVVSGATDVPVEPLPLVPACPAARAQLPPAANRR
jgi:OMF family outer membrane factor